MEKNDVIDKLRSLFREIRNAEGSMARLLHTHGHLFAKYKKGDSLYRNGERAEVIDVGFTYERSAVVVHYELRKIKKDGGLHLMVNKVSSEDMSGWE